MPHQAPVGGSQNLLQHVVAPRGADDIESRRGTDKIPQPIPHTIHPPTGLVRVDRRAAPHHLLDLLIERLGLAGQPFDPPHQGGLGQPQPEDGSEQRSQTPMGNAALLVQLRGQGQSPRADLVGRRPQRIGGLPRVPALHPPPAFHALSHVNPELGGLGFEPLGNVGLMLHLNGSLLEFSGAVRTTLRQRRFHHLIDSSRHRTAGLASVGLPWFPPRFAGVGFRSPFRERRGGPLGRSPRLFQQRLELADLVPQAAYLRAQPPVLSADRLQFPGQVCLPPVHPDSSRCRHACIMDSRSEEENCYLRGGSRAVTSYGVSLLSLSGFRRSIAQRCPT